MYALSLLSNVVVVLYHIICSLTSQLGSPIWTLVLSWTLEMSSIAEGQSVSFSGGIYVQYAISILNSMTLGVFFLFLFASLSV